MLKYNNLMNKFANIGEGLASWLNFELRVGHENLFCESYLAYPLSQLISHRYPGRVINEVKHPVLADTMIGAGKRPSIDYAINKVDGIYDLAVETKWVSKSPTLLRDILRDIIRLDLLIPNYAKEGILICAGKKRDFVELFDDPQFKPYDDMKSKHLLPIDEQTETSLRFIPIPKFRESLLKNLLSIYKNKEILISKSIRTQLGGPFLKEAKSSQYEVYVWRIKNYGNKEKFKIADEYKFDV